MKTGHFRSCDPADCWCEFKRYGLVFLLTLLISLAEVIGGLVSGSLALLSDAGHGLVDSFAVIISMTTVYLVKKHNHREHWIRSKSGYASASLLFLIAGWLLIEAWRRFWQPQPIITSLMMGVAIAGLVGNWLQHQVLIHAPADQPLTHRAMDLHVLSDLWQSVAVIGGGAAIAGTGFLVIDPALSVLVALVMASWAVYLWRQAGQGQAVGCSHHH